MTIPPISACNAGSYGANCASTCPCVEANTQICAATDGACTCKPGWEGVDCTVDVDECLTVSHPANAMCVNTDGSFVFMCNHGYVKSADGTCSGKSCCRRPHAKCTLQCDHNICCNACQFFSNIKHMLLYS